MHAATTQPPLLSFVAEDVHSSGFPPSQSLQHRFQSSEARQDPRREGRIPQCTQAGFSPKVWGMREAPSWGKKHGSTAHIIQILVYVELDGPILVHARLLPWRL